VASETNICNMALMRTGVTETISNLNQQNKHGRVALAFYAVTRDAVLADFDWNFARKRQVLTPTAEAPATNWSYAFALPNDCLKVRGLVVDGARCPKESQKIPYEIAGRFLFTDVANPELIYTGQVEDTGLFPPMFVSALAWALVPEFAIALAIKGDMAAQAGAAYGRIKEAAIGSDLSDGYDSEPESDFLTARY